jgi:iron(III) transport system substrate-binding protein
MKYAHPISLASLGLALGLSAAGSAALAQTPTLTLYSAQHPQVDAMLAAEFTKETGIKVLLHEGEGPDVANQLIQEGADSPADVFFTENSPELNLLDEKGLLAPVDPATLKLVPAKYSAESGNWVGVLARENVLAYNPAKISAADLPVHLLDLAKPEWKGKVGIAPSDSDFLPLVSAVIKEEGKAGALAWLQGLKANALVYEDDEGAVAAVARGDVATAIINNYYWDRLETELGPQKIDSRIYHFKNGDVGGLINISGAAVLKSSKNQAEAQQFLAFLDSEAAQQLLGKSEIDYEYPLRPGVPPNAKLTPFKELTPPDIDVSKLGDDQEAGQLLQQAGLI